MAIKNKRYCPIMKLSCDYFDICHDTGEYDFKKVKKVFKNLDLDYILLTQTKRKVIKQEFLTLAQTKFLVKRYQKFGLKVVVARYMKRGGSKTHEKIEGADVIYYKNKQCAYDNIIKRRNHIVIAAFNFSSIKRFIKLENIYDTSPKTCLAMGLYLGYPSCCSRNHLKNIYKNGEFNEVSVDKRWDDNRRIKYYECPLINNIWPLFLHIPCNFKCQETYKIVKRFLDYYHHNINKDFERWYFYYIKYLKSH